MSRVATPVVEFSTPLDAVDRPLQEALDTVKAAFGHVADIVDITLLSYPGGYTLTGAVGAGTSIFAGTTAIDLSDVNIDEARVIAYGIANTATATIQVYDVTNALVLCSLTLAIAAGIVIGAWTSVGLKGGDRRLELRVIGDAVHTQVIDAVHLQLRTSKFRP